MFIKWIFKLKISMSGVTSMHSQKMPAVFCFIFTALFSGAAAAQGLSANTAVLSLGLIVVGALAIYVAMQIRNALRSDIDRR